MSDDTATATPPLCRDCLHLLGNRSRTGEQAFMEWRCYHPSNISDKTIDVVTGERLVTYVHSNIYSQRSDSGGCKGGGLLFQKYVQPTYIPHTGTAPTASAKADTKIAVQKLRNKLSLQDI